MFGFEEHDTYTVVSSCSDLFRLSGLDQNSVLQSYLPTTDEWRLFGEHSITGERYPFDTDGERIELLISENPSATITGGKCKLSIVIVRNYTVFVFKWLGLSLITVIGCLLTLLMDPKDHISDRYSSMIVGILIMVSCSEMRPCRCNSRRFNSCSLRHATPQTASGSPTVCSIVCD